MIQCSIGNFSCSTHHFHTIHYLSAHMRHRLTVVMRVCVCVCVWFDFSIQHRIGQEDLRVISVLQKIELKCGVLRKTASSQNYKIRIKVY